MNILKKTVAISLFSILSSASYAKNAYVDQFISFTNGAGVDESASAQGGFNSAYPVSVNPTIATGAPVTGEWVSLPQDYMATYGFNGQQATGTIGIFSIANGANEVASVFGRLNSASAWSLIGTVTEGGGLGLGPQASFLTLTSAISQIMVKSHGSAGVSPGFDLMGIQGTGMVAVPVPEPETYALMGLGLIAVFAHRRKAANT
jgi:hypothetical protein